MKKIVLLLVASTILLHLNAQDMVGFSSFPEKINPEKVKQLELNFESLSFFLDNEFKSNIVDGYTWTGAWVRPKLSYTFSDQLKFELGGHFLRYHGRDKCTTERPWFSARWQMTDRWQVVFGNLDQHGNHGLSKQLWEPERVMTDTPEEGIQFLYDSPAWTMQTWVNWEQFILPGDPWQEHFTFGTSNAFRIYSNSEVTLDLPVQLLMYHQGGEIDATDLGVVTHLNYASGLNLGIETGGQTISKLHFGSKWIGYECPNGPSPLMYESGHGISVEASALTRWGNFSVDYWNAYRFASPFGKRLYQSASSVDLVNDSEEDRSLISLNYGIQKEIVKDIRFSFQGEAIYDLPTSKFSFGFGFYMAVNHDFFLAKLK